MNFYFPYGQNLLLLSPFPSPIPSPTPTPSPSPDPPRSLRKSAARKGASFFRSSEPEMDVNEEIEIEQLTQMADELELEVQRQAIRLRSIPQFLVPVTRGVGKLSPEFSPLQNQLQKILCFLEKLEPLSNVKSLSLPRSPIIMTPSSFPPLTPRGFDLGGEGVVDRGGFQGEQQKGERGSESEEEGDSEKDDGLDEDKSQCTHASLLTKSLEDADPVLLIPFTVEWQFTKSASEARRASEEQRRKLETRELRIMKVGTQLYWVAADICLLVNCRRANVAKKVGRFKAKEKCRMLVKCKIHDKGTEAHHLLLVLTERGVYRLFDSTIGEQASRAFRWFKSQLPEWIKTISQLKKRKRK